MSQRRSDYSKKGPQAGLSRPQIQQDIKQAQFLPMTDLNRLFPPDTLLPCQTKPAPERTREHRLLIAVLEQALTDAEAAPETGDLGTAGAKSRRHAERLEARAWFDDRYAGEWPLSFVAICEAVDLEPDYLRRLLKRSNWQLGKAWRSTFNGWTSGKQTEVVAGRHYKKTRSGAEGRRRRKERLSEKAA